MISRRHELEKNIVADRVAAAITAIRPHMTYIAVISVAGLLVFIVALIVNHSRQTALGKEWADYISAQQSKNRDRELEDLSKRYPESAAGVWAALSRASSELDTGTRDIYESRNDAIGSLESAIKTFESVLEKTSNLSDLSDLAQHARFGISVAQETMGEVGKAIDSYEEVVAKGDKSPLGNLAQRRLDALRESKNALFYEWFRGQNSFDLSGASPSFPGMPSGFGFPDQDPAASRDQSLPNGLRDLPAFPDTSVPAPFIIPGFDIGDTDEDENTDRSPNPEIPSDSTENGQSPNETDSTPATDAP
jgi:tetratricopeptide (TPR) repeat protein